MSDTNLKTILTTSSKVDKEGYISDEDLYYYLSSCPFFQTYQDEEVGRVETILLPFFRYYQWRRLTGRPNTSFSWWMKKFNTRLSKFTMRDTKEHKKLERYLINYYALFHPSKAYDVILPYYPYRHGGIRGCAEVLIKSKDMYRIYCYNFTDEGVGPEDLNYYGFKLQCAARVFYLQTGLEVGSLACVYPASKAVVYYTYNPNENIETLIDENRALVRRYGSHCAVCTQKGCTPLIDKSDRYGWRLTP